MATHPNTAPHRATPVHSAPVSATVIDLAEARRVALLRRLWAEHDGEGRAI